MATLIETITQNYHALLADTHLQPATNSETSQRWAEALKKGIILFYGHQEVETGIRNIDWTGAHVHHQEWPAQLNRFFWLQHLAAVYDETQDEALPEIARTTIEDWIDQHDYSADTPPAKGDNTLNISIRLGQGTQPGWWGTVASFAKSGHYDDALIARMIESSKGQLACLESHLAPVGNWRISHLDCLLFCGLVVPDLAHHVPFAVRHLNEAFYRQIHDDGSHEEHNPSSYHSWMCNLYTRLWYLGQARPDLGLHIDTERAARMWDYMVYATAPDGGSCGIHDGGVWTPGPGKIAAIEKRQQFLEDAGLADDPNRDLMAQPSRYFESAGQLFLRDGWDKDATYIIFDATRWGGGHCHLSRLSVNLYARGRMLLCDPGIFSYEMSDPYAPHGKTTPAHNTIHVGGLSQTEADPVLMSNYMDDQVAVFAAAYEGGYYPGTYTWGWSQGKGVGVFGRHQRILVWLKERGVLVFDTLHTDGNGQPFGAHWQFPVGGHVLDAQNKRAWTQGADSNILVQNLSGPQNLTCCIYEGQKDPLRGWLPDEKRNYHPAPLFAIEGQAGRTVNLCSLLLPFSGDTPPQFEVESLEGGHAFGFRLMWADGEEDVVACTPGLHRQIDQCGSLNSDAALALIRSKKGVLSQAFVHHGMTLMQDGKVLIEETTFGTYRKTF